jgi:PilZ domain
MRSGHTPSESRACGRRAVALRVDYATGDGRVWLGLVRNLSLQGMYIESALRHVAHEVAAGNLLTVAFVLPSGRPCKLRAMVIHDDGRGCGVQFLEGSAHSLTNLSSYWYSVEESEP